MERYLIHGKILTMADCTENDGKDKRRKQKEEAKSGLGKQKVRAVYEDGYVHIVDGKIADIGEMSEWKEVSPKDKADIVDVGGRTVMPGLIEAHCHMGITEEKKGMEGDDCNEDVEPVTPYLRAIDAINPMDAAFDDAVRAGITSAMIGPGSSNVVG